MQTQESMFAILSAPNTQITKTLIFIWLLLIEVMAMRTFVMVL